MAFSVFDKQEGEPRDEERFWVRHGAAIITGAVMLLALIAGAVLIANVTKPPPARRADTVTIVQVHLTPPLPPPRHTPPQ